MNDNLPTSPESQPEQTVTPRFGLAVASLILGIVSIAYSLFLIGLVIGVVGLFLAYFHLSRHTVMKKLARWGLVLSIVGILLSCLMGYRYFNLYRQMKEMMGSGRTAFEEWVGKEAPNFTVKDLEGNPIELSKLRGRRVVLDFWATWCGPCRKEIPHFIELRKKNPEKELVIIGISKEEADQLRSFARKKKVNYPLARAEDLPAPYSEVTVIPTTFFIDRRGVIQEVTVGYCTLEALKTKALGPDYQGPPEEKEAASE